MKDSLKFSLTALIIAIGMIISALLLSKFFVRIKHEDTINVKGYAEKVVKADIGKFQCSFSVSASDLKSAYEGLQSKKTIVMDFLKQSGFKDDEIDMKNINTYKMFKKDAQGNDTSVIDSYTANQAILITSKNVELLKDSSKKISELIKEGIEIFVEEPQFFISDPSPVKFALIEEATKDGYKRAETMAKNSGGKVGGINSAKQGVIQITAPNSTEVSDYGIYDTSTIEKTVKVTVILEYSVEKK